MPDFVSFVLGQFPRLNVVYVLALAGILAYWGVRLWREGRQGRVPRVAWWSLPGWLLLLYAPLAEQPTFFALGAFALLVAEFWPGAYRSARQRPAFLWPLVGVLLGVALLLSAAWQGATSSSVGSGQDTSPLVMVVGLLLLLGGAAELLSALSWRDLRPRRVPSTWPRWAQAVTPEFPDLSVTVTGQGAELKNVSRSALALSGWSPARVNGWLVVRDIQGQALQTLNVGETAVLPLSDSASGVRVWYRAGVSGEARLFRADWTPQRYQQGRVLN